MAYAAQGAALTGELYWDTGSMPRPGILLIHGAAGLDDHARGQASRYAALGYVVSACDMLGDRVASDRERVIGSLTALRDDPGLLAWRARAGLAELVGCGLAREPFAAIGFCFGGLAALTLARSGAGLAAAVSIHGSLATTRPVKARVLACHGALNPHVPMADVTRFAEEMDSAGADWQLIIYGGARHGFTHQHAVPGKVPGVAAAAGRARERLSSLSYAPHHDDDHQGGRPYRLGVRQKSELALPSVNVRRSGDRGDHGPRHRLSDRLCGSGWHRPGRRS